MMRATLLLAAALPLSAYLIPTPVPHQAPARLAQAGPRVGTWAAQMLAPERADIKQRSASPGSIGFPSPGPPEVVGEKDACGVGFIAKLNAERSHDVVARALKALGCMEHRGACGGDRVSGDGAGIMTAVPWELLKPALDGADPANTGVGMVFLPQDDGDALKARELIEAAGAKRGLKTIGWREVPVDPSALGEMALAAVPQIAQVFFTADLEGDALEEALYLTRRSAQADAYQAGPGVGDVYLASLSSRSIVYKGMVQSVVLPKFYKDLSNVEYSSHWAIYHRRFSTNTVPKWPLAQPMRLLGHNGEINTVVGNTNWQRALDAERERRAPLCTPDKSDSANLDGVFEWMVRSGHSAAHSLSVLVPEAYKGQPAYETQPEIVDMYDYYAGMQEPWDGPALLVFSDGKQVGAALDRNGLRPARYFLTKDGMVAMMSETGVVDMPDSEIISKGRLGPGHMIICDLEKGDFYDNMRIKQQLAAEAPYGEWLKKHATIVEKLSFSGSEAATSNNLPQQLTAFGWSQEDIDMQIADMANAGKETLFSMGDDTPLAVLSSKSRPLYDYFKQRFAQVTNPAIDPLREGLVMGLEMSLGKRADVSTAPKEELAEQLRVKSPILNEAELKIVRSTVPHTKLSTIYALEDGPDGLEKALDALCEAAAAAVRGGVEVVELSDYAEAGLGKDETYIPPLLAVATVHHYLIAQGLRLQASIVVETAQAWSTHHIACLVGYGASAVHPYLAYQAVKYWHELPRTASLRSRGQLNDVPVEDALENFRSALEAGLLKILSKMGISLLASYHGAQIFEAIGLGEGVMAKAFKGTPSRVGGLSFAEIAQEVAEWHTLAHPGEEEVTKMQNYGFIKFFSNKEFHHNSPPMTKLLHKALNERDYDKYKLFQASVASSPASTLRDMIEPVSDRKPISIDEVEPVERIMERFCTGGMSLGALSREAHETLAIGVNRAGGKSNSGEGGEDPVRWNELTDVDAEGRSPTLPHLKGLKNGDIATSKIKQVASGRFGVTPAYLRSAEQIEIKIAQGAKPGEGGQLPGPKINDYIAGIRYSKPGVTLISPPPHHDIYSIEDLAQLIYDLHMLHPKAKVSVKLVSCVGIGTVAAGVAKANADVIQISGHDGGTGASPLSSIKHAGGPWELGIAEVQHSLMLNNLRERVVLRVDGGLKTGYDIVLAACLGADEYGFGTIAMIAEGCIMARICHTNSCPVGVTTQKEKLREKFVGTPQNVLDFLSFVAQEARSVLAELGYKSMDELIGRADLLQPRDRELKKTKNLDLSFVSDLPVTKEERGWTKYMEPHTNGPVLDDELLARADVKAAIADHAEAKFTTPIINTDRAVSARLAGEIAFQHGNTGWKGSLDITFEGNAGQSFGAFCLPRMSLTVVGDANDYVGKGMHGGSITVKPPTNAGFTASDAAVVGNTCLYGATGGRFFAHGRAGERFAVRNSAAHAVVEGAGDHACEYMTGGVVVVLGRIGRNAGAGMTGGLGYFLDEYEEVGEDFAKYVNQEVVSIQRVVSDAGKAQLRELVEAHVAATGSPKATALLADWDKSVGRFWQLVPPSEAASAYASAEAAQAELVGA